MSEIDEIRRDLIAEQDALDDIVSELRAEQWALATPSAGWDVGDQIGHLTYFDGTAAQAISDPDAFGAGMKELFEAASRGLDDATLGTFRRMTSAHRLAAWRKNRLVLAEASLSLSESERVVWYGPSMGAKSFLTARLMEVWAHGTDIVDTVGVTRAPTDRLRHIAQLGYITRRWSYGVRGLNAPDTDVALSLIGPNGDKWSWGSNDASDEVSGSAEEFCLVVTQRRHLDDTSLVYSPAAREWLLIAQAFAGGATDGPAPRTTT